MNRTVSFCVKNQQGLIALIRILKVQPSGACYIDYEKKNNNYHLSLHPPKKYKKSGQMHIKKDGKIILKRSVPNFHDFNSNRCFESVMILETELRKPTKEIPSSVVMLEIPKNHLVHIMFVRSDKAWGHMEAAFISDKPTKQEGETIIPYPAFYSIEDMPDANYYLTYHIQAIDEAVLDYIEKFKENYIRSEFRKKNEDHVIHIRNPFISTDIEISITSEDIAKYQVNNQVDNKDDV